MTDILKALALQLQNKNDFTGMSENEIASFIQNIFVSEMQEMKEKDIERFNGFNNSKKFQKSFSKTLHDSLI